MIKLAPSLMTLAALTALGGCVGFGDDDKEGLSAAERSAVSGKQVASEIGVNAFLWRATLDTLSFMPLASADPFGGVVITDWFADPRAPGERFKVTVYILDTRLRADGINVAISKQRETSSGWVNADVNPDTAFQIENAILTRARELRLATES